MVEQMEGGRLERRGWQKEGDGSAQALQGDSSALKHGHVRLDSKGRLQPDWERGPGEGEGQAITPMGGSRDVSSRASTGDHDTVHWEPFQADTVCVAPALKWSADAHDEKR